MVLYGSHDRKISHMTIDFDKCGGLVPSIIQDAATGKVLMLGYT